MVYGSETWAMKAEDMQRLDRTERMMMRWLCGVRLSDKKAGAELLSRLDIESVSVVVRRGRLRWFGHVKRKQPDDWVSAYRHRVVESVKGRGRGRARKTWRECVEEDISKLKLCVKDTKDRAVWRNGILGNCLTRAVARKNDVKR
jgi:hypothetical protein